MQFNPSLSCERLVKRYVHSGNIEIHVNALNISTGVFTSTVSLGGLGLTIGNFYKVLFNMHSFTDHYFPNEINTNYNTVMYLYVVSDTTLQISTTNTSAGLIKTYTSNTNQDLTKFHFEVNFSDPIIDISNLNLSEIKVRASVQTCYSNTSPNDGSYILISGTSTEGSFESNYPSTYALNNFQYMYVDYWFKYIPEQKLMWVQVQMQQSAVYGQAGTYPNNVWSFDAVPLQNSGWNNYWSYMPLTNFQMTSVKPYLFLANNSVIEIYDLKGRY